MSIGEAAKSLETHDSPSATPAILGLGYKVLAATMIGLGLLGFASGDFASVWQRIPIEHLPGYAFFAHACALVEFATGLGLLLRPLRVVAARVLVAFLLLWAVLLKLPAVVAVPQMEATWLGLAEVTVMLAAAWIVWIAFDRRIDSPRLRLFAGSTGLGNARRLYALSLLPIGLAHFFYIEQTAAFVPAWLPWHVGWAWLTGAGSIAACVAILSGFLARLAAATETAMLAIITILVWTPGFAPASNGLQFQLTGFLISAAIAAGSWVVADSCARTASRGHGKPNAKAGRCA